MRDVSDRQQTPQQVAQSHLNAVLLAPQMAVDALNSSAGNFWRPGAFAQFLDEAEHEARRRSIRARRNGRSPACRWSSSPIAAAICRPPIRWNMAAPAAACAASCCSTPCSASRTSSRTGSGAKSSQAFFVSAYSDLVEKPEPRAGERRFGAAGVPVSRRPAGLAAFRRRRLRRRQRGEPRRFRHRRLDRRSADRRAEPDGAVALS